jgi:hypothetical protein
MQMNDAYPGGSDSQIALTVSQHRPASDPGSIDLFQIVFGPPFSRELPYRPIQRV